MWFKVSDDFFRHRKTLDAAARLGGRRAIGRVAAVWLEAGLWTCGALTDGFVPDITVDTFTSDTKAHEVMRACAESGLFLRENTGYRFHDFLDYNPSAEEKRDERERDKQRKKKKKADKAARLNAGLIVPVPMGLLTASVEIIDGIVTDSGRIPDGNTAGVGPDSECPVPVPVPDRSSSAEVQAPRRRVARMRLSIWEVRNHLIAATYALIQSGAPYVDAHGLNVTALGTELARIAHDDLHAEWNYSRELQHIVDVVIARMKRMQAGEHLRANFERLERKALRRLGRMPKHAAPRPPVPSDLEELCGFAGLTRNSMFTWFAGATFSRADDGQAVIGLTPHDLPWVEKHYSAELEGAARRLGYAGLVFAVRGVA